MKVLPLFELLDLLGVAVFAISGVLAASRKRLDWLGALVIATLTAVGGGTLRDLLLDRHPIFWIQAPIYLYVILLATGLTIAYTRLWSPPFKALLVADAVGLAFFTIAGAQVAERGELPAIIVVVMGVLTGAAGGVLRDVVLVEIPTIMRRTKIYATASLAGGWAYLLLQDLGVPSLGAALGGMGLVMGLRLAAIIWGLTLPELALPEEH